jgi:hypothetical protein
MNNTTAGKSGFSLLWCTKHNKLVLKVIIGGQVEPAPSSDGKDGAPACIQRSTMTMWLCGCLWRDSSQNAVKHLHQTVVCKLIILALCCACSLPKYQFPVSDSWQKQMYDNLDILCLENTRYKSSLLPCRCHTLHFTPSGSQQVWPRWSAPRWCRFDYSTHTREVLSSSFETNDSPSMLQEVWERVEMWIAHMSVSSVLLLAVYRVRWPYDWTSALNWYEIQLFFLEYFSGFASFPTLVTSNLTVSWDA